LGKVLSADSDQTGSHYQKWCVFIPISERAECSQS
jgi:hypothetical protein